MNASESLLHALLDRGDYFENFTRAELLKILPILERAHNEVLGMVAKTGGERTRGWREEMAADIDDIYKAACEKAAGQLKLDLKPFASEEAAFAENTLRSLLAGVSITAPAPSLLKALVNLPTSIGGSTLDDLFEALAVNSRTAAYDAISAGMLEGDTVDAMTRRIRGEVVKRATWSKDADGVRRYHPGVYSGGALEDVSTRQAEALARTAVMHVGNQAREVFYKANEDIIKGYQRVETLDLQTCIVCGEPTHGDGHVYGLGEVRPELPAHINCRGIWVPVLKSFRDLGIDADELPPSTRASMDGQVPEFTTWNDRLAAASSDERVKMLGRGRADLYERGVGLEDMVKGGEVVPLKDIKVPKTEAKGAA